MKFGIILTVALLLTPAALGAQTDDAARASGLTSFIGVGSSYLLNSVSYKGFRDTAYVEKDYASRSYAPSLFAQLYGKYIVGEFTLGESFEKSEDSKLSHYSSLISGSIRFMYDVSPNFAVGIGPGFYMETLPSSKSYDGGGFLLSIGTAFSPSENWKLILNIIASYGSFGEGDDSTKTGFGIFAGAARKFGRF